MDISSVADRISGDDSGGRPSGSLHCGARRLLTSNRAVARHNNVLLSSQSRRATAAASSARWQSVNGRWRRLSSWQRQQHPDDVTAYVAVAHRCSAGWQNVIFDTERIATFTLCYSRTNTIRCRIWDGKYLTCRKSQRSLSHPRKRNERVTKKNWK